MRPEHFLAERNVSPEIRVRSTFRKLIACQGQHEGSQRSAYERCIPGARRFRRTQLFGSYNICCDSCFHFSFPVEAANSTEAEARLIRSGAKFRVEDFRFTILIPNALFFSGSFPIRAAVS